MVSFFKKMKFCCGTEMGSGDMILLRLVHNMTQDAALRCTQRTQRKIEIDPILAFTTQHDASATEGVHKLKRNATQRLASYCEPAFSMWLFMEI